MDGYKTLKAGQDVTFELEQGPKGLHAKNIAPNGDILEWSKICSTKASDLI